ncbi:unnamed protein product, partial [Oppiella nova]
MCQYSVANGDGIVGDWHLVAYGSYARGGAGLVMCEATGVEARGRITPACSGLWDDSQIEPWARITRFIKQQGSVPGIQLTHAGRKASTVVPWVNRGQSIDNKDGGWDTIGASPIAFGEGREAVWKVPKEATHEDLDVIKAAYVSACGRAVKAGFEVIELHFAHGYLVSTFLSPITNHRTDTYGGCLENRMRLGLEIAHLCRQALPQHVVLGVRVSVSDYTPEGWDVSQTIEFAKQLKQLGVDFVDCSSGGVVANVDYHQCNTSDVQRQAARDVHRDVGIMTAVVGKVVDPMVAEKLLRETGADLIMIGRALLNNPH